MKNKNKEYWEKRQLAREELSFNKGTEAYREYVKILSESKKEIENKIAKLYAKYQQEVTKLGIDKIQANRLLRGTEFKEWRYDIGKYVEEIEKLKKVILLNSESYQLNLKHWHIKAVSAEWII